MLPAFGERDERRDPCFGKGPDWQARNDLVDIRQGVCFHDESQGYASKDRTARENLFRFNELFCSSKCRKNSLFDECAADLRCQWRSLFDMVQTDEKKHMMLLSFVYRFGVLLVPLVRTVRNDDNARS